MPACRPPLQPGGYLLLKRLGLAHCCDGIDAQKVGRASQRGGASPQAHPPLHDSALGMCLAPGTQGRP